MSSRFEEGSFNGRSNPDKRSRLRPVVHVPSRAACHDDVDAALERILSGIVEKHKAQYSHHKGNQR